MKKIEAIIRTSKYEELKQSLHNIGIDFFTWWEVTGQGNDTKFKKEIFRGSIRETSLISRRLLSIIVRDINLEKTIECILKHANTGEVGDGKIFVSEITAAYRIRTGECGEESLFIKDSPMHAYDSH
jgi:nitrogen regulatory protein P-II 1